MVDLLGLLRGFSLNLPHFILFHVKRVYQADVLPDLVERQALHGKVNNKALNEGGIHANDCEQNAGDEEVGKFLQRLVRGFEGVGNDELPAGGRTWLAAPENASSRGPF